MFLEVDTRMSITSKEAITIKAFLNYQKSKYPREYEKFIDDLINDIDNQLKASSCATFSTPQKKQVSKSKTSPLDKTEKLIKERVILRIKSALLFHAGNPLKSITSDFSELSTFSREVIDSTNSETELMNIYRNLNFLG